MQNINSGPCFSPACNKRQLQENQELGSQVSTGETKQLEARIAQQDKKIAELTKEAQESEKFVLSLDDETEGLQGKFLRILYLTKLSSNNDTEI